MLRDASLPASDHVTPAFQPAACHTAISRGILSLIASVLFQSKSPVSIVSKLGIPRMRPHLGAASHFNVIRRVFSFTPASGTVCSPEQLVAATQKWFVLNWFPSNFGIHHLSGLKLSSSRSTCALFLSRSYQVPLLPSPHPVPHHF
jgi:hypothetical protein